MLDHSLAKGAATAVQEETVGVHGERLMTESPPAHRPPCPRCQSIEPIPIAWGLPVGPIDADGKVAIGGCDPSIHWPDWPEWECGTCGLTF